MTRQPSLVSQRGERDRLITALGPDAERGTIPALRRQVLDVLLALPPGARPADRDAVLDRLDWQAPRRAAAQRPLADAMLAEADVLGVTAAGGLTGYSRTLLAGSRAVAEQVLDGAIPPPVDHFLVQPDLTLVVPGPPTADLAAELAPHRRSRVDRRRERLPDHRVLDPPRAGRRPQRRRRSPRSSRSARARPSRRRCSTSSTTSPAATARCAPAWPSAYLRCDDEALLARVLGDRDVAELQLRRIAPTVVVSTASVGRVLDVLREAGYAPAAEDPDGSLIALGAEPPRAPSRPAARARPDDERRPTRPGWSSWCSGCAPAMR